MSGPLIRGASRIRPDSPQRPCAIVTLIWRRAAALTHLKPRRGTAWASKYPTGPAVAQSKSAASGRNDK